MKFFVFLTFVLLLNFSANAQSNQSPIDTNFSTPFYKWEIGLDLLPLIDKSKDAFGFIIKRNFQTPTGRSALRLKVLPQFLNAPGNNGTGKENNNSFNLAIGYERQKTYGHFGVFTGFEPFFKYSKIVVTSLSSGNVSFSQTNTIVGISGFVGARYYLGKHLAVTLESHLIYQHQNTNGDNTTASAFTSYNQLFINPIHAFYVSYHF